NDASLPGEISKEGTIKLLPTNVVSHEDFGDDDETGDDVAIVVDDETRDCDEIYEAPPIAVLERRLGKLHNKLVMYVLVQWTNRLVEEATQKIYVDSLTWFSNFDFVS
ncbi:hypothetical protein Tco_0710828, partial [Tanacetum coccineum]